MCKTVTPLEDSPYFEPMGEQKLAQAVFEMAEFDANLPEVVMIDYLDRIWRMRAVRHNYWRRSARNFLSSTLPQWIKIRDFWTGVKETA